MLLWLSNKLTKTKTRLLAVLNKQQSCFLTVTRETKSCLRQPSINIVNYSVGQVSRQRRTHLPALQSSLKAVKLSVAVQFRDESFLAFCFATSAGYAR